jgi:hypothetical protein
MKQLTFWESVMCPKMQYEIMLVRALTESVLRIQCSFHFSDPTDMLEKEDRLFFDIMEEYPEWEIGCLTIVEV